MTFRALLIDVVRRFWLLTAFVIGMRKTEGTTISLRHSRHPSDLDPSSSGANRPIRGMVTRHFDLDQVRQGRTVS